MAEDTHAFSIVHALAFLCEIVMLPLLVIAGHDLVDGMAGWLLGIALAVVALSVLYRWMAPASPHRLAYRDRLVAQTFILIAIGCVITAAGHPAWGVGFAVIASAIYAARRS